MIALDTNVIVRLLVRDDEKQAKAVYARFKQAEAAMKDSTAADGSDERQLPRLSFAPRSGATESRPPKLWFSEALSEENSEGGQSLVKCVRLGNPCSGLERCPRAFHGQLKNEDAA